MEIIESGDLGKNIKFFNNKQIKKIYNQLRSAI